MKVPESVNGACTESGVVEEDRTRKLGSLGIRNHGDEKVRWEIAGQLASHSKSILSKRRVS